MPTDQDVLSYCDRYLSETAEGREAMVGQILGRAADPEYETFAARVVHLLRETDRAGAVEQVAGPLMVEPSYRRHALWVLGYALSVIGRPARAIPFIRESLHHHSDPDRMLWLAVQHAMIGDRDAAASWVSETERQHPEHSEKIVIVGQFVDFVTNYDRSTALGLLSKVESRFASKSVSEIEADIRDALTLSRPFLLLRMGDGEGSCIRLSDEDEKARGAYYRANRDEFGEIWYGDKSVFDDPAYMDAVDTFNNIIVDADAIGGIYSAAIEWEYSIASRRGIAWVVNVMRKVLALADASPEWAARVPISHLGLHYDLLLTGALARLLRDRKFVGVVTCQDRLPSRLQHTYGIQTVELVKVPGEQIHAKTLGEAAVAGRHWPDRYNEICAYLDSPRDRRGELWLVAAGILGKIYAAKLKSAGAVVIDIGAVADLWMGKSTRSFPSLPDEVKLMPEVEPLTLVDVGGLGGVGEEWLPHKDRIRAVLFEPNPSEAAMARTKISDCPGWLVVERALGNRVERRTLHVTRSLGCTSLLEPNGKFLDAYSIAPAFRITHEVEVDCVRFDTLLASGEAPQPDAVKIDVQGFEYQVLEGFGAALHQCLGVKVEAHLYPIYEGQKLLHDLVDLLGRSGLTLRRVSPVDHFDGDIVEVDAWFTLSPERAAGLSVDRAAKLAFLETVWGLPSRRRVFGHTQFSD